MRNVVCEGTCLLKRIIMKKKNSRNKKRKVRVKRIVFREKICPRVVVLMVTKTKKIYDKHKCG